MGAIHARARARDQALLHYTAATKAVYPARARAEGHYHVGHLHAADHHDDQALKAFGRAVAEDPTYADAHVGMGLAHQRLQQRPEALAAFARALALQPDHARAHYHTGLLHEQDGDLRRAVASYQQAVERAPSHAQASAHLMDAAIRQGDFAAAEREARRRVALQPDDTNAMVALAMALSCQAPERSALMALLNDDARLKEALDWLDRAVAGGYANRQTLEQSPNLRRVREQSLFAFNRIVARVGRPPGS
jgi:tetratricopeptide (TPR) repeat protein